MEYTYDGMKMLSGEEMIQGQRRLAKEEARAEEERMAAEAILQVKWCGVALLRLECTSNLQ